MKTSHLLLVAFALLPLNACTTAAPQTCPDPQPTASVSAPTGGSLNKAQLELLSAPNVLRAKLYLDDQGAIIKVAAYVPKEALPAWVHEGADKHLGAGQDDSYEQEIYKDAGLVYEITRIVDGQKVEVSLRADDQSVYYIERVITPDKLPQAAQDAISNEQLLRASERTQGDKKSYQVRVQRDNDEHRLVFDEAGALTRTQRLLDTVVEITPAP